MREGTCQSEHSACAHWMNADSTIDRLSHLRRRRYDVDLVLTNFDESLWETMQLMQSTDLFMGMHGAGFTNTLFLPKVRSITTLALANARCKTQCLFSVCSTAAASLIGTF